MSGSQLRASSLASVQVGDRVGRLAVFDLDRTLLPGSSLVTLGRVLAQRGLVSRRTLVAGYARDAAFRRLGASDATAARVRDGALRHVAGLDVERLGAVLDEVGRLLVDQVRPAARLLVRRHLQAGDFVVVLSASPQALVEAVAARVGAHRAVGTRPAIADGVYTGDLDGPFCYGAGKLVRLQQDVGPDALDGAAGYADSASDLPVLEACHEPVAVCPDRALREIALRRGWPVVHLG
jgi:HAD superfamily hydrolase (TIGR01490 family)